jgi:hypothetical protein
MTTDVLETITAAVRSLLLCNPAINNMIKSRIFPQELPLDCVLPAISIYQISNPYNRITGAPRVQISSWSKDYLQCQQLNKLVEKALDGYSGIIPGFEIISIIPLNSLDIYEQTPGVYQVPYDFQVTYLKIQ